MPNKHNPIARALINKSLAPLWNLMLIITFTKINVTKNSTKKMPPPTPKSAHAIELSPKSLFLGQSLATPGYNYYFSLSLCWAKNTIITPKIPPMICEMIIRRVNRAFCEMFLRPSFMNTPIVTAGLK